MHLSDLLLLFILEIQIFYNNNFEVGRNVHLTFAEIRNPIPSCLMFNQALM